MITRESETDRQRDDYRERVKVGEGGGMREKETGAMRERESKVE